MRLRLWLSVIATALVTGCAIRANQLDTARRLLPSTGSDQRLEAYAWRLSIHGANYILYPVEALGRRIVFVNGDGARLEWDGDSIIVIDGLPGAFGRYESGIEGNERWYAFAGEPAQRARCTPRRIWRLTEARHGWRQECLGSDGKSSLRSSHLVQFDAQDNIAVIEASLSPGRSIIRLERQGP